VICWVLGEYGPLAPGGAQAAVDKLVDLAEGQALSEEVRSYLLSALGKLHAQAGLPLGPAMEQLLHDAASSHNADIQLRAIQIRALLECAPSPVSLPPHAPILTHSDVDPVINRGIMRWQWSSMTASRRLLARQGWLAERSACCVYTGTPICAVDAGARSPLGKRRCLQTHPVKTWRWILLFRSWTALWQTPLPMERRRTYQRRIALPWALSGHRIMKRCVSWVNPTFMSVPSVSVKDKHLFAFLKGLASSIFGSHDPMNAYNRIRCMQMISTGCCVVRWRSTAMHCALMLTRKPLRPARTPPRVDNRARCEV
jgi:hypothetical protein